MRGLGEDTTLMVTNTKKSNFNNNNHNTTNTSSSTQKKTSGKFIMQSTQGSSSSSTIGSASSSASSSSSATATSGSGGGSAATTTAAMVSNSSNNNSNMSTTIALPKASHANTSEEIAGGVQDTIYLCNFRVSVDGEWLCLKELQDLDIQDGSSRSRNLKAKNSIDDNNGIHCHKGYERHVDVAHGLNTRYERDWANFSREPSEIERSNLVNICKLVVKELLEQSLRYGRMLDSDHLPLQHFFIVIEHVLGHGLRPKKGLLGPRKELWDLLQSVENYCIEAQDITASVRDLPTVRTHIGRARAWLRIALMQKKLADYLQALIDHRDDYLVEYYEPHALMMSDEIVVIMGILVGLNVIDCNLCVKEEDLDSQQGVIDFSLYLRSSSRGAETDEDGNNALEGPGGNMIAVLDQKNYIEELNRHLNATVGNLQAKVESLTTTNALMKEDLAIARNSLLALQAENQALRQNTNSHNQIVPAASMQSLQSDHSSNSSNKAIMEATQQAEALLAEEQKKNEELEKELKLQISLKAESDMAMKLLEKDIHEKQDTIVSLRRQLDDIKQINLEMYRKLQECDASLKHKTELLAKLESQKEDMANTIYQLEQKWSNDKSNLGEALRDTSKTLSNQITASEERAALALAEAHVEREWRVSLQEKEVKLKEQIVNLQSYIKDLNEEAKRSDAVKVELEKVRHQWKEAQTTLEELGIQLSVNKLKVSELQEKANKAEKHNIPEASSVWTPDNTATNCTACKKDFNLTRRKHHCRHCGEIFCKSCSEQTFPLPNEHGQVGKGVRVCDNCYVILSKRK